MDGFRHNRSNDKAVIALYPIFVYLKIGYDVGVSRLTGLLRHSKTQGINKMKKNLKVMKEACEYGINNSVISVSGLIGGDAPKVQKYIESITNSDSRFIYTSIPFKQSKSWKDILINIGKRRTYAFKN